ncbi:hypothetical protein BC826DRAFT_130598 [Russula brevipes]|nr:hypothetical protein BC826DRAFT_130598 [Russula brevipes]
MSTQMPSRCLHLPDEVLVEILSSLCPRDIAACQRACRQLNDIVVCSQFLQYLIRVGRSGLHDPMLPGYTIPQRIEALERWEASWRNLEAQSSFQVRRMVACELAGGRCSEYIIHDDFLIATSGYVYDLNPGYGYVDLRVSQPERETDPWIKIIMDTWSGKRYILRFFPEQDLVVATFWSTDNSRSTLIELHGFSFSRGTPHPRFVSATITTTKTPVFVKVTIVGNHTILDVRSGKSQGLFLHSWKDGRVSQLRDAPNHTWSVPCATLSYDTIALVENYTATLEICRIVEEPESGTPLLRTLARLGLPPLASGMHILFSNCFLEQMPVYSEAPSFVVEGPGRPPRRHPFHNSPEERIVTFSIKLEDPLDFDPLADRFFTIVTHVRTLIAHVTTTLPEVDLIPWKDWGPSGTVCFERDIAAPFGACVGERLATISGGSLTLLDFNSMRVRNTIQKVDHPSRDVVHSVVKDRVVIPRGQLFGIDVVSELPHISVSLPVPVNWVRLSNHSEGLAAFSKDVRGRTFSLPCSSGN